MELWAYGELVVIALTVSGLFSLAMQQKSQALQVLLRGQTQISELRRRTIQSLEYENAELNVMLRTQEARLRRLASRIEVRKPSNK